MNNMELDFEIFTLKSTPRGKSVNGRMVTYGQKEFRNAYMSFPADISREIDEFEGEYLCLAKNKVTNEWYVLINRKEGAPIRRISKTNRYQVNSNAIYEVMKQFYKESTFFAHLKLGKNISSRGDMLTYKIEEFGKPHVK